MLTPLKTGICNPLYASPLLPLSCLSADQEEVKRQNDKPISELQVHRHRPKTFLQDMRQELQREVVGLPFDQRLMHIQYMWLLVYPHNPFSLEREGFAITYKCTFGFSSSFLLIELKEESKKRLADLWKFMPWTVDLLLLRENKSPCLKSSCTYATHSAHKTWISSFHLWRREEKHSIFESLKVKCKIYICLCIF